jgi:Flp pilus assembly protein TadG
LRLDRPREAGVSLVEFSLVVPLFLLLTIGLLITALVVTNQVQLANAVRDGARAAGVCGGVVRNSRQPVPTLPDGQSACTTANLKAYITAKLNAVPGGVVPAVTVTANGISSTNLDACDYGGTVDIRITYRQPLYAPFVDALIGDGAGTGARTITAAAQATCEQ